MTLNVHLSYAYTPQISDYLQGQLDPNVRLTTAEAAAHAGDIHILIDGRPDRDLFLANKELQTLIVPWTGIPPETRDLLAGFPHIALHNLHHNAAPVAELAVALLLAAAKNLIPFDKTLRAGDWTLRYQRPAPSLLLLDKTVLILGYGAIGRRIARICRSIGMNVLATKRNVLPSQTDPFAQEIHPPQKLHELLPRAQALVVALPLTPATKDLIGRHELALMPADSVLVNIGRALLLNEEALYQALKDGSLGAAGLDVWYNYPSDEENRSTTFPSDYAFWELDNVVMSPHRAGLVKEIDYLRMDHLAVLLNAAARIEEIPNRVDIKQGY